MSSACEETVQDQDSGDLAPGGGPDPTGDTTMEDAMEESLEETKQVCTLVEQYMFVSHIPQANAVYVLFCWPIS